MTSWPRTLTPHTWTVWAQDEDEALPRQVAWSTRRRVAERLFDIVAAEREPGVTVTLWSPAGDDEPTQVGEQTAAIGP